MTGPTALTIGNFDGVHRAHVELIRTARNAVGPNGRVVVLSFDPHPVSVLRPRQSPARLTHFHQRVELLKGAGANKVVAITPTKGFLNQADSDFITSVVKDHRPSAVIEGPDFRFGKGRTGTVQTLAEHGKTHGFETIVIDPVQAHLGDHSLVTVSSSLVRWLITRGRMRDAATLLGRSYALNGTVAVGEQRGRTIGVPTINLDCGDLLLPRDGVYAGTALRDGKAYPAAISVGTKPSFGEQPRVCEAHLLDYDGPLDDYGWQVQLRIEHWLRDQLVYRDVQPLQQQMHRDVNRVRSLVDPAVDQHDPPCAVQ